MCDSCGKEFIVDEIMDMPPYWFAVTISIADKDGFVPEEDEEKEKYFHFCSQACFGDYASGQEVYEMRLMVDKQNNKDKEEEDDDEDD